MIQAVIKPELHKFSTCKEFAEALALGEGDLIFASKSVYETHFEPLNLGVQTIFRSKYGSEEPTDVMVDAIIKDVAETGCNRIIAIGGGAVLDIAKAIAVAGEGETLDDLYNDMPNLLRSRALILVPTTCGTGSEVTNISVINRTRMGTKMGLVGQAMYADMAVLIPELLQDMPFPVFATSSIDALVHAVESALSPKATVYTKLFSYKAIEMIIHGYQKIVNEGRENLKTLLDDFLTASNLAGIAFGTAGCGTVHAMAYPLGGQYHVAHGESNYALFIGVMKNYTKMCQNGEIAVMNEFLSKLLDCEREDVYSELEKLLNNILPKKQLREYGVTKEDVPSFAENVVKNQKRLLGNAFVEMTYDRILKIYEELY